ncbi:two-component system, NtrC family, C4-dicarboxylate transport sensor histidine kinase DctB [Jannaschia faecimaris]|uniref:C4-dicarboxylate transport sensor protein DctB n=1 Tax=Jannaschia faecimaris TaxID=1244108 RepID=A0A1H3RTM5_9RHOB|nr:ATP-binding protein [Jannaschia faecimaris]SDZ28601.1 two-component system, NtrC family, C4-dicarboxylate transport sensor histidine kinase DctB [Jannaschia faecimaris]
MHRALLILLTLFAALAMAGGVWWTTLGTALTALQAKGGSDLSLAADRLRLELQRSRDLAVLLAADPGIAAAVSQPGIFDYPATRLQGFADRSGASDVLLLKGAGTVIGSASGRRGDLSDAVWMDRARQGALGVGPMPQGPVFGGRVFAHAAPTFDAQGKVSGAVAVTRDLAILERGWRGDPQAIYFTDTAGHVVVSNREELLGGPPPQIRTPIRGLDIRRTESGRYIPRDALHLELPQPTLGLTAEILLDTAPARQLAQARGLAAGAALLVLGGLLVFLWERRRVLARANQLLEVRVAERTAALTDEIRERREAEAALTRAQAELVQASKLSALGQLSAGISHELNQPLMAIRSFAQNAATFLNRGNTNAAGANLTRINDLAGRMGRIIRNLSAFARSEPQPAVETNLATAIEGALEITESRRAALAVETEVDLPDAPVLAMAGEVRMGQVLVNLIANAVDAMADSDKRRLTITLTDGPPTITVRDTGPGLTDPEAIFDPFYTTKEVGAGLGLGLSLSYGIVQGFGGDIRGRNTGQGAEFVVTLRPAEAEAAA